MYLAASLTVGQQLAGPPAGSAAFALAAAPVITAGAIEAARSGAGAGPPRTG